MMIHDLLRLTRPLFTLDVESTGINPATDRIIEIGFQQFGPTGLVKEWRSLVNPGIPIPASSTKVHHITDEIIQACQACNLPRLQHGNADTNIDSLMVRVDPAHVFKPVPTFAQLAANLATGFRDCDYAGKSVRFDLRILAAEMQRAKQPWSYMGARIIDADRLEQLGEPRHLSQLYRKHTGKYLEQAHSAMADVRATTEVIEAQLQTYQQIPRDLDVLHAAQWPGELDTEGKFRLVNGVATCQFGKWRGTAMRNIEPSYWDWILKSNFPDDVMALASAAKLGKYPDTIHKEIV